MKKVILCTFALLLLAMSASAQIGTALRELPYDFHPGDAVEVRLQVSPPPDTTNWVLREMYPAGWDLIAATNAASSNEFTGELVFGPFSNAVPRYFNYEVSSLPGRTNSVVFSGEVTFDGASSATIGTTNLPARNEWLFVGPQSLLSADIVNSTAYGARRWAASIMGWVTTIENGGRLTYPRRIRHYGLNFSRLKYVGGLFLLFGASENGAQLTISDDGLSWKVAQKEAGDIHSDPFREPGSFLEDVAYGNRAYVAVGYHYYSSTESEWAGAVFRSTNGYNWKRVFRLLNPSRKINAVTFAEAEGRFLAVGTQGTLLTSTNGLEWAETFPITGDGVWTNRELIGICHGPAGWLIPSSVAGVVLSSPDGENWSVLTGTSSPPGDSVNYFWQSFYADGRYWFSHSYASYSTDNGSSWTRLNSLPTTHPAGAVNRAPDGVVPAYLAAGENYGSLVSSTNGNSWTLAVEGTLVFWPQYLSVASINNEYVVSAQDLRGHSSRHSPNDRKDAIWLPTLGTALSIANSSTIWRRGQTGVAYADMLATTNGILAAGARRNQLWANFLQGPNYALASSTALPALNRYVLRQGYKGVSAQFADFESVKSSLAKTPAGFDLFAETYSYVTPSRIDWGHFTSTNGSDWTLRENGLNNATNFPGIRGLAWGAGRFVAVSEGRTPATAPASGFITSTDRIYTSTDGESYSALDLNGLSLGGEGLTGVAFGAERFVAIGNSGRILSSTNGTNWVTVRASDGRRWNRVRYLDGIWGVVGNGGWIAFSPDGERWHSRTAGAESDLTDIARRGDQFMLVGSHAMVLLSQPVTPATVVPGTMTKLPGAGLQFTVSGHPGRVVDIESTSDFVHWSRLDTRTNTAGTAVITDSELALPHRFYRVVQQP